MMCADCGTTMTEERRWCRSCVAIRQERAACGLPPAGMSPVGIVLQDFEAPKPQCRCGGDLNMPRHEQSLTHLTWAFAQDSLSYTLSPTKMRQLRDEAGARHLEAAARPELPNTK